MRKRESLMPGEHRRNLIFNSMHEMFWGFGMAFHSTYAVIPLFLASLGAPDIIIASVAGVFVVSSAIPQILTAFVSRNIQNLKFAVITVHGLPVPPLFVAGFIFAFIRPSGPHAWMIYYVCFLLFTLGIGVVFPIWADFLETVHIPEKRGSFFGISFAFNFLAGGIGGITSRRLLATSEFPAGFGYGFLIYSGCIVVASLLFLAYRTRTRVRTSKSKTFKQFLAELKRIVSIDRNFRNYLYSRILLTANYPAISLYAAHAHSKLKFDISEAGVFTAIAVIIGGFSSYTVGWVGDKFGYKRSIIIVFIAYFLALVTALMARTLWQTYLIFVFLGMAQGGFWTSAMSLVYEFAGEQDKKIYFALIDTLTAPFVLLFIVLAGLFIPVHGIPIVLKGLGVFLLLGILSLAILTKEPKTARAELPPQEGIL